MKTIGIHVFPTHHENLSKPIIKPAIPASFLRKTRKSDAKTVCKPI